MKATILIVEDDDFLRPMLQLAFERRGFTVLAVGNVADGLALAATRALDAVLTDFQLPDESGLELCRTLARRLPVWVMTGSDLKDQAAAEAGARTIIRKPFKPIDVCRQIERGLRGEAEAPRPETINALRTADFLPASAHGRPGANALTS